MHNTMKHQVHASNALGCINPVEEVAAAAHAVGAKVLVDGCQSVPNMPVDVQVGNSYQDLLCKLGTQAIS